MSFDITSNHFNLQIVHFALQFFLPSHAMNCLFCVGGFVLFCFSQMSLLKNFSGIFRCCPRQAIMLLRVRRKRKEVPFLFTDTGKNYRTTKGKWSEQFYRSTLQTSGGPSQETPRPQKFPGVGLSQFFLLGGSYGCNIWVTGLDYRTISQLHISSAKMYSKYLNIISILET